MTCMVMSWSGVMIGMGIILEVRVAIRRAPLKVENAFYVAAIVSAFPRIVDLQHAVVRFLTRKMLGMDFASYSR